MKIGCAKTSCMPGGDTVSNSLPCEREARKGRLISYRL